MRAPFRLTNQYHQNMCLYTKQILPIRARKDITCYKVVLVTEVYGIKHFYSPFYFRKLCLGVPSIASPKEVILPTKLNSLVWGISNKVDGGYIHCYTDYQEALDHCCTISNQFGRPNTCLLECIIPKGTLYFKSDDGLEMCGKEILPQDWLIAYTRGHIAERNIEALQKRAALAKQEILEKAK